jgi:glycosyltransferase involved in cell wall biosynthesis
VALQALKRILKMLAPPGSRRRAVVRSLRRLVRGPAPEGPAPLPAPPKGADDPYNFWAINRILWLLERPLLRKRKRPGDGEAEAARWVLTTLMFRADLRRRYAQPLRGGPDGGFCRELCAMLGERSAAADAVRAVFARGLEKRPRQRFDCFLEYREAHPLGLTPAGRAGLLVYLLAKSAEHAPLSDEEILWFHLHNAEDPYNGLIDTYLLTPAWQERFPDGLTRYSWDRLRAWVRREYRIAGDWLDGLPVPSTHDAVEAECLHRIAQARVGQVCNLPLREAGCKPAPQTAPLGANVIAHFRYPSGLMEAALNTVRGLERAGVRRSCRDLPNGVHNGVAADRADCLGLEPYDVTLLHMAPEPLVEVCYPLAGLWRRPGVHSVAVWYWELETAPPEWARHAALLDEVWAPTRFIHGALQKIMPIPVTSMLPGMLPPVAPDLPRAHFGLDPSKYLFLFVFDMNSVFERKNPLAVVSAFREAFSGSAEVQLAIKLSRGAADPDNFARLRQACDEVGCVLIDRVLSREESYGLLNVCDCYVSLHRSEGFGLTMAEAMFFGKPVIATGYSGNLDFMSADNSILIPYEKVPLPQDYMVYRKGCLWAEPSVPAAAAAMRHVVDCPAEARALGERARHDVANVLSLDAYGRRMRERLEQIRRTASSPIAA